MLDYRQTFRTLENALASIERSAAGTRTLSGILDAIILGPGPSLGLVGGRLYRHDPDQQVYVLEAMSGEHGDAQLGFTVRDDYAAIEQVESEGLVVMEPDDPGFDPTIEGQVGVERFAAIAVGEEQPHVIAFTLGATVDERQAIYLLGTLRHVINLKLMQRHLISDMEEARKIQMSLLPSRPPNFGDFDIAGRSVPAERVGGDLYDYLMLSEKNLGVAVVDASGHGLPAALMARDVITGLRVVLDVQYRMVRAIEKVNRVVARSGLASRFITLFYAEFESYGSLIYCNAGHPPPLLWRQGQVKELTHGGIVLGPDPKASFERGFENFPPGSVLLLYTDGITEAANRQGKQFGVGRLTKLLKATSDQKAAVIVDGVFDAVTKFAPGPMVDDQTVVVIRRPGLPL